MKEHGSCNTNHRVCSRRLFVLLGRFCLFRRFRLFC